MPELRQPDGSWTSHHTTLDGGLRCGQFVTTPTPAPGCASCAWPKAWRRATEPKIALSCFSSLLLNPPVDTSTRKMHPISQPLTNVRKEQTLFPLYLSPIVSRLVISTTAHMPNSHADHCKKCSFCRGTPQNLFPMLCKQGLRDDVSGTYTLFIRHLASS